MDKQNNQSDPYRELHHPWGPAHGLGGHPHDLTAHLTHNSYSVYALIDGDWCKGEMTFHPGHNEVHLDGSAVHIGSLTNGHFVVHEGTRWFNMHVNHSNDGETHVYTTPIGHSPFPTWEEMFFDAHTLPPLPEIHLPDYHSSDDDDDDNDNDYVDDDDDYDGD